MIRDLDGSLGSPHFLNVARVNGISLSFSGDVCCADCRSICWARSWPSVVQAAGVLSFETLRKCGEPSDPLR